MSSSDNLTNSDLHRQGVVDCRDSNQQPTMVKEAYTEMAKAVADQSVLHVSHDHYWKWSGTNPIMAGAGALIKAEDDSLVEAQAGASVSVHRGATVIADKGSYALSEDGDPALIIARKGSLVQTSGQTKVFAEAGSNVLVSKTDQHKDKITRKEGSNVLFELRGGYYQYEVPTNSRTIVDGNLFGDVYNPIEAVHATANSTVVANDVTVYARSGSHVIAEKNSRVLAEPGAEVNAEVGSHVLTEPGAKVKAAVGADVTRDTGVWRGATEDINISSLSRDHVNYQLADVTGQSFVTADAGSVVNNYDENAWQRLQKALCKELFGF